MITSLQFPNLGRLGNHLFQYASYMGIAAKDKNQKPLLLNPWKYAEFFEGNFPVIDPADRLKLPVELSESGFHYNEGDWNRVQIYSTVAIKGYLQSEKYFAHCREKVREALTFKDEIIEQVKTDHDEVFVKPVIAISIRRGDYTGNPNYAQLPITYYFLALQEHFPDWREKYNILFFSDDIDYCRFHFGCFDNCFFSRYAHNYKAIYRPENNSDILQLCLGSQCDHFIIANSTFSWWMAWLGEREDTKIIRPAHHFAGKLKARNDIKDYYPERWVTFDHLNDAGDLKKIDLTDVTFTIPVAYDHPDRKQNMDLGVCLLQRSFNTNIIVGEALKRQFEYFKEWCAYLFFDHSTFHRTAMLNDMARCSNTAIIANWDADMVMSPIQLWEAVERIRKGADMVYPYDGRFARVNRDTWFGELEKALDPGIMAGVEFQGMRAGDAASVGGAILFNKKRFFEGGGENENYISYGPEDRERFFRFKKLGFRVERVPGVIYHLDHWKGPDSRPQHVNHNKNMEEHRKIKAMDEQALREYVHTWKWREYAG